MSNNIYVKCLKLQKALSKKAKGDVLIGVQNNTVTLYITVRKFGKMVRFTKVINYLLMNNKYGLGLMINEIMGDFWRYSLRYNLG